MQCVQLLYCTDSIYSVYSCYITQTVYTVCTADILHRQYIQCVQLLYYRIVPVYIGSNSGSEKL
jgi:hypothetical protein